MTEPGPEDLVGAWTATPARYGTEGCTCQPFTARINPPRYLQAGDKVDRTTSWQQDRGCPRHGAKDDPTPPITVKRIGVHIPVTAEQLLDAGLPLPPGMEPPPPAPRPSRYQRWRWAYRGRVQAARERVGFWIAGYEPDDPDW